MLYRIPRHDYALRCAARHRADALANPRGSLARAIALYCWREAVKRARRYREEGLSRRVRIWGAR